MDNYVIIGIDPGKQGAIVSLEPDGHLFTADPMPVNKAGVDEHELWLLFKRIRLQAARRGWDLIFAVEKVFTMPTDVESIQDEIRAAREEKDIVGINGRLDRIEEITKKRDGRVGILNYGIGYGKILGQIAVLSSRTLVFSPRTWQKVMWVGADMSMPSKDKSRQIARRLWQEHKLYFNEDKGRRKHPPDGLVDAALIAEYARRSLG